MLYSLYICHAALNYWSIHIFLAMRGPTCAVLRAACERDRLCPRNLVFSFPNPSFADVLFETLLGFLELSRNSVFDVLGLFLHSLMVVTLRPLMS